MLRFDTDELEDFLGNFKQFEKVTIDKKLMTDIGDAIAGQVKERTEKGLDVNHKRFDDYSESYKKRRKRKGRQTERVTLNDTGKLMGAIARGDTRKDEVKVGVFAANEQPKAAGHQHGYKPTKLPKRKFIGISNKDRKLMQTIDRLLDDRLDDVLTDIVRFQVA